MIFPSHWGYFLEPGLRGLRTLGECVDSPHVTFLQHTFYMSCELFVLIQIARNSKPWKWAKGLFLHFSFHTFVNAQFTEQYNLVRDLVVRHGREGAGDVVEQALRWPALQSHAGRSSGGA